MIRNFIPNLIIISVILHSVLSDKGWNRGDVESPPRHRNKYSPPQAESYASIPVAVVYEDNSSLGEKSLEDELKETRNTENSEKNSQLMTDDIYVSFSKNNKDLNDKNIDSKGAKDTKITNKGKNVEIITWKDTDDILTTIPVSIEDNRNTQTEPVTRRSENDNISKDNEKVMHKTNITHDKHLDNPHSSLTNDEKRRNNLKLVSSYPTKEIHIPVAVIYDTDTDTIRTKKRPDLVTSSTTKKPKIGKQRRQQQKGFVLRASTVNEDKDETISSGNSKPKERYDASVLSKQTDKNKEQLSVAAKVEKTPVTSQNEPTSDTTQKIKIRSRTRKESAKSTIETSTQNEKKTRERDPVVPIVESKSNIYSQTGEFRYR